MKLRSLFLAALALGVGTAAHAVAWNSKTDFSWNAQTGRIDVFPQAGTGQMWATGQTSMTSTGPQWGKAKALPFNPSPTANFKAKFTPAAMAKGMATGMALPLAATVIQSLLSEACVRVAGGQMVSNGSWEECKYKQETRTVYIAVPTGAQNAVGLSWSSSKEGAAGGWAERMSGQYCTAIFGGINRAGTSQYSVTAFEPAPVLTGGCATSYGTSVSNVTGKYFTDVQSVQVPDGFQSTTTSAAEAKLSTKMQEWSQTDFTYGRRKTEELLRDMMESGHTVDATISVDPIPAIQSPPRTSTTTAPGPNGSTLTTTTTTTTNNTYQTTNNTTSIGIVHNTTTTTLTTHPDGSTTTTVEGQDQTPTQDKPEDEEDTTFTDTALPEVPTLYEQKYPDGLSGVWQTRSAEFKSGPIFSFVQSLIPNVSSSATCPTFPFSAGTVLGVHVAGDLSVPCNVWTFIRWVMIISAMLLARRLIFGG